MYPRKSYGTSKIDSLHKNDEKREFCIKIGKFKNIIEIILQVSRANEVAQFPSEDPNFHLVYNSSNLGFFVCPHGSSLWGGGYRFALERHSASNSCIQGMRRQFLLCKQRPHVRQPPTNTLFGGVIASKEDAR